jgi:hypothetical protein
MPVTDPAPGGVHNRLNGGIAKNAFTLLAIRLARVFGVEKICHNDLLVFCLKYAMVTKDSQNQLKKGVDYETI